MSVLRMTSAQIALNRIEDNSSHDKILTDLQTKCNGMIDSVEYVKLTGGLSELIVLSFGDQSKIKVSQYITTLGNVKVVMKIVG